MLLGALVVVLTALSIVLAAFLRQLTILNVGPAAPVIVIYAAVGVVVARRQPRNPIGWILLVFILLLVASTDFGDYAVLAYRPGHHLPLAPVAVVLQPLWVPAILLFPLVILLFPDGRLASRRWRWVLWVYAGLGAGVMVALFVPGIIAVARHDVHLDSFGDLTATTSHPAAAIKAAEGLTLVLIAVSWLSFVGHQVVSWRRATGERRQQLKWLASGAAITVSLVAVSFGIPSTSVAGQILGLGLVGLPVSIGVGILKYRLYDIDRIISRTLAYAVVTGFLIGVYAGLVLLATSVLAFSSSVAVAVATLTAAALFSPLRRRIQRVVDRRFNRSRYDAEETTTAFAGRLKEAVDLDSVHDDLVNVVQQALEPAHLSVWISRHPGPCAGP